MTTNHLSGQFGPWRAAWLSMFGNKAAHVGKSLFLVFMTTLFFLVGTFVAAQTVWRVHAYTGTTGAVVGVQAQVTEHRKGQSRIVVLTYRFNGTDGREQQKSEQILYRDRERFKTGQPLAVYFPSGHPEAAISEGGVDCARDLAQGLLLAAGLSACLLLLSYAVCLYRAMRVIKFEADNARPTAPLRMQAVSGGTPLGAIALLVLFQFLVITPEGRADAPKVGGVPLQKAAIPVPDRPGVMMAAHVFVPSGTKPKKLVVINHGYLPGADAQRAFPVPVYGSMTRWFLARDFIVVLPLRRGYGETGGSIDEQPSCSALDFDRAGLEIARDIQAAIEFSVKSYNVDRNEIYVVGHSAGGWGALSLASRNPSLRGVINFAGGMSCWRRHRDDPNLRHLYSASWQKLAMVAESFGQGHEVPSLWIYAEDDPFIDVEGIRQVHKRYRGNGSQAHLHMIAKAGPNAHTLFSDPAGLPVWSPLVEQFLKMPRGPR